MNLLYLDPGTGSMLIQFLVAALTGVVLFFKQIKLLVKDLFFGVFKKKREDKE